MKKIFSYLIICILMLSVATALSVTETKSSIAVAPGGMLTLTYQPAGFSGDIGWIVSRAVPAGWTIQPDNGVLIEGQKFALLGTSTNPFIVRVKAPTTIGNFQFTGGEFAIAQELNGVETEQTGTFPNFNVEVKQGVCTPNWQCGDWGSCTNSQQTRTCTDANSCGTNEGKPALTQQCGYTCEEDWSCGEWLSCGEDQETTTRTCTDANACGTTADKPDTSKKCGGLNLPEITGDPTLDMIIWIFIGLFALSFLMRMMPGRR